jgi:hypothetical protein
MGAFAVLSSELLARWPVSSELMQSNNNDDSNNK